MNTWWHSSYSLLWTVLKEKGINTKIRMKRWDLWLNISKEWKYSICIYIGQVKIFWGLWFLFLSHLKINALTSWYFLSLARGEARSLLGWFIIRYGSQWRKWWCWWLSIRHFPPRRDVGRRTLQFWKCCFSLRCKAEILISWNTAGSLDCSVRGSQ